MYVGGVYVSGWVLKYSHLKITTNTMGKLHKYQAGQKSSSLEDLTNIEQVYDLSDDFRNTMRVLTGHKEAMIQVK